MLSLFLICVQNNKLYSFYDRAYANAVQDDLWTALQAQAVEENVILPATVKEIMVQSRTLIVYWVIQFTLTNFHNFKGHLDSANGLSSYHSST